MRKEEIKTFIKAIASQNAVVQLSEEDLAYLLEETEVRSFTSSTDETGKKRVSLIVNELTSQCEYAIDCYHNFVLLIYQNPVHPLMTEELQELHQDLMEDALFEQKVLWKLTEDKEVPSLKVTLIMSRKSVATVKELVEKYEFAELIEPLGKLCKSNWFPVLQENYAELKQLTAQHTTKTIRIAFRWEGMSPLIDCNASVWDEEAKNMIPLSLYQPLEKLLSMQIFIDESVQLDEIELLAGILCDITYLKMQQKQQ